MSPKRVESLSSVDVAWYHMEDPTNLMMITGVISFDAPVDFERLKATLDHRFVRRFRRFRQRVVAKRSRFGRPYWEDDPNFDIDSHLHRIALPAPGDQKMLQTLVSDLMSTPLDFSKPLWQMHLVEGRDSKCVLLVRLHHAIGDGIALVQVMLSLTDTTPDAPVEGNFAPAPRKPTGWSPIGYVTRPAKATVKMTKKVTTATVKTGMQVLRDPEQLVEMARTGSDVAFTTGRLLLMAPDPKTAYKGKLGIAKRAAWSEPIPLDDVKAIGRAAGGTVNDVLMSAAAGAMRRYLLGRGATVDDLNFRAIIPVNLRRDTNVLELGNKFGLVFLSLPIGIEDPVERLQELKRRMDDLKDTSEPVVAFGILNLIGMMPDRLEDVVVEIFGTKGTLVMTNVPGPREQLYFAGAPVGQMVFWVPQSGRLGLGVSILSYNGQVTLGVASDGGLVPDPEAIVEAFHEELLALQSEMRERLIDIAVKFNIPLAPEAYGDTLASLVAATEPVMPPAAADTLGAARNGDAAAPAMAESFYTSPDGDDLVVINGIGPSYAHKLITAGITSFAALASCTPDVLGAILDIPDWRRPDFQSWIDQAKALVQSA